MNSKFIINTLIGAVSFFVLGFLFYEVLLGDFMSQYMNGSAEPVMWALTVAQLGLGALLTWFIGSGSARDWVLGAKAGFYLGLMYNVAVVFDLLGTQDVFTSTTGALIAIAVECVRFSIAGAIMAAWMGRD